MSEPAPVYVVEGVDVREFNCKECGAMLGMLLTKKSNGKTIHYLERWGDCIYHGDILCSGCGSVTTWSINQVSYQALMAGRLTKPR